MGAHDVGSLSTTTSHGFVRSDVCDLRRSAVSETCHQQFLPERIMLFWLAPCIAAYISSGIN